MTGNTAPDGYTPELGDYVRVRMKKNDIIPEGEKVVLAVVGIYPFSVGGLYYGFAPDEFEFIEPVNTRHGIQTER